MLRDLKIKDRSAQLIADTYINKSDKADALQVAGSLAFLCQRSPVEIPEMVFKMFATGDLLKMSGYQRWVGSISKMAKVCATGSQSPQEPGALTFFTVKVNLGAPAELGTQQACPCPDFEPRG